MNASSSRGLIQEHILRTVSPAVLRTLDTPPVIPVIAARAKAVAVSHPGFIRGDQGQVVGAASKEYLIPGARTGYLIGCDSMLINEWLPRMIRATSSSPNVLGQRATLEMLAGDVDDLENGRPPTLLLSIRNELKRRRDRMAQALQRTGWTLLTRGGEVPRGGISMFARLPDGLDDDRAFLDCALDLGLFSAIPGSAFGAPGCVRFGYAGIPVEQIDLLEAHLQTVAEHCRCE